jgi:protein TonB
MIMFARYASAASSSAAVTFALLFVMQLLITLQPGATTEPRIRMTLGTFILKAKDTPVRQKALIRKKELTNAEVVPQRTTYSDDQETIRVPRTRPAPPIGTGLQPLGEFTDGPLVVMVRVAPIYPARAIAHETEGYVVVQFDVTVNGQVTNAVVLESTNSVFDNAAIKAAEKFKFKPRIVDGVAFKSYGIRNLFRFSLDDS